MFSPRVTFVAGLPGSGKTPYGEDLEETGTVIFDDFKARAHGDSPRFASARRYAELLEALRDGRHCVVLDLGFCRSDLREEAERVLRKQIPGVEIEWRFFANDRAQCEANIRAGKRSPEPRLKALAEFAADYSIPDGATQIPVFSRESRAAQHVGADEVAAPTTGAPSRLKVVLHEPREGGMDPVTRRLADYPWPYASQDPAALDAIAHRVAASGARESLLTYSEVVSGVDFRLASVHRGAALRLGVPEWTDLHRAIVGDFLGRLCLDTYLAGQFMGSALVVGSETRQPSEGYRQLMRELGLLHGRGEAEFLTHWVAETRKAYAWYAAHH